MQYYAVIDTNVLVSAILKFKSIPGQIIMESLSGCITPLLCDEIIAEYKEVLSRPKFQFDPDMIDAVIDGIKSRGIFLDATSVDDILLDFDDVVFYEVVMTGRKKYGEAYLVTGNIKHFPIKTYIVTPKEMLEIIQ